MNHPIKLTGSLVSREEALKGEAKDSKGTRARNRRDDQNSYFSEQKREITGTSQSRNQLLVNPNIHLRLPTVL